METEIEKKPICEGEVKSARAEYRCTRPAKDRGANSAGYSLPFHFMLRGFFPRPFYTYSEPTFCLNGAVG